MSAPARLLAAPAIDIQTTRVGWTTVVAVRGDLDLASGDELAAVLSRAIDRAEAVLLDLGACAFVDSSSGLETLLEAAWYARDQGARLAVAGLRVGPSHPLFQLVCGRAFFSSVADRASGLSALR